MSASVIAQSPAAPAPAATPAPQTPAPVGELFAADSQTRLVQPAGAGISVVPGSELSAGIAPARLRLYRGGQVRICPRSSVSVNAGQHGLMFSMSSGMLEVEYTLFQRGSDFIITPDFTLRLLAPGAFHFALGVSKAGNTCFKALPGNNSPVLFSETMGSGVYRTRPLESVSFQNGKAVPVALAEDCGCPVVPALQQASAAPVPAQTGNPAPPQQPAMAGTRADASAPLPADHPGQVHIQVDTPFVFSAKSAGAPDPYSVAKIRFSSLPNVYFLQEKVDPVVPLEQPAVVVEKPAVQEIAAVTQQKTEKRGFFGRIKRFFGGIFRH